MASEKPFVLPIQTKVKKALFFSHWKENTKYTSPMSSFGLGKQFIAHFQSHPLPTRSSCRVQAQTQSSETDPSASVSPRACRGGGVLL